MDTTPRHSFYKRMVFLGLIAANLFGAFFALTMSRFPSQSSPRPVTAVDAPGTIRLNSSSTLTPALTSSYTTASHSVSGVSSTSFQMSYAKTSSGAFSAHSLADQGFVANLSALSNITHIVVSAKLSASYSTISTYPPNLLVMVSDTYFSDPMSYYSALSSRTLSTSYQSFDYDVSSYGMTYFAVGCYTRATGTLPDVVFQSITFSTRAMTSLSLSGDSSIHFANDALPYPYTATANFNDQTTENVTTMATVNSSIDTMKLGSQTLSVSYGGFTATKSVDVTNVGASSRTSSTAGVTEFSEPYLYNRLSLGSNATLNGRTVTFQSASTSYTGAWDISATPIDSAEYNAFSGSYWQLGNASFRYSSLTLTSRTIFEGITSFSVQAKKNSAGSSTIKATIAGETLSPHTLTGSIQTFTETLSPSKTGRIAITFTQTTGFFYLGHITILTSGGVKDFYTPSEQATALRNYVQLYKTCSGGVSDATVARLATEYNALNIDQVGGSTAKSLYKNLTETVNDYDYTDANQYASGTYVGGNPSVANVNAFSKLATMVRSYNKNHSTKIYLYDTSYYGATDNGGTNGYLPVFVDGNGKVLRPDETGSSLSLTLIIVAVSGGVTLLGIAGLYFFSKAKNKRMSENRRP